MNYQIRLLPLVGLLTFSGCETPLKPDFSPPGPRVKILTYNINWGFVSPKQILDVIEKSDADIVCLQETNWRWRKAIEDRLQAQYPHRHFTDASGAGGIAFLSKRARVQLKELPPTTGWFPALLAAFDTPLGKVQVLNLHLRPSLADDGSVTVSALYKAPKSRLSELEGFMKHVDPSTPLIAAGDFNEDEDGEAVQLLLEKGMKDCLSKFDTSSYTWCWTTRVGISLSDRYDHIVAGDEFECTGARVTTVDASDHMPVEAVLVPRKKPGKK